jgi:hypothetical protein
MIRIYFSVFVALIWLASAAPAKAALTLSHPTVTNTIPANGTDFMVVTCPAGTKVLSGGWTASNSAAPNLMVWVSRQVLNTWRIMTVNKHPSSSFNITGFAVCAGGVAGISSYFATVTPVNVPAFNAAGANAFCTNGGIPTGGGFDSNFPDPSKLIPVMSYPNFGNQWFSAEYNSTNTQKAFSAFVTCGTGLSATVTPRFGTQVAFSNGLSAEASVECDAGDFAVGGGYVTSVSSSNPEIAWQKVRTFSNRPTATNWRRWTVRAHNANQFDWAFITPVAQCLHLN